MEKLRTLVNNDGLPVWRMTDSEIAEHLAYKFASGKVSAREFLLSTEDLSTIYHFGYQCAMTSAAGLSVDFLSDEALRGYRIIYVERDKKKEVTTPSRLRALQPREEHWVEVMLVNEEGEGVPQIKCIVIAADKQQYVGLTDTLGIFRVDGLVPGTCQVSFPELDAGGWKTL
jgi:hypothetical protein